jgi:hypothetical protein
MKPGGMYISSSHTALKSEKKLIKILKCRKAEAYDRWDLSRRYSLYTSYVHNNFVEFSTYARLVKRMYILKLILYILYSQCNIT